MKERERLAVIWRRPGPFAWAVLAADLAVLLLGLWLLVK